MSFWSSVWESAEAAVAQIASPAPGLKPPPSTPLSPTPLSLAPAPPQSTPKTPSAAALKGMRDTLSDVSLFWLPFRLFPAVTGTDSL